MEKCPYCNSTHIHKSGHYKDGRQRYRCVDCHHMLHEGMEIKEKLNKTCPYCGSTRMRKAGHNKSGSQRYYCNDCKRKSSDNEVQIFFKEINTDIECPYCHSHNLKKGGHLKSGAQRYICIDCNRYFSDKTVLKKDLGLTCPTCGSTDIRTSGIDRGKQRYRCHTCKRRFVIDKTERDYKRYEKTCPRCGHTIAKAAGHTGDGTPYFKCLECGHKYLENPKFVHTSEETKKEIKELYRNDVDRNTIAEKYNISVKTVYHITKDVINLHEEENRKIIEELKHGTTIDEIYNKYKRTRSSIGCLQEKAVMEEILTTKQRRLILENIVFQQKNISDTAKLVGCTIYNCKQIVNEFLATEKLSQEQKNLIYRYGVLLNSPLKYITPHVRCSVDKCREFISKFDKVIPKKVKPTETERKQDWAELDKFIMK